MALSIKIKAFGQSEKGNVRKENQDRILLLEDKGLFLLADGVGGFAGGDVAAERALELLSFTLSRMIDQYAAVDSDEFLLLIRFALIETNHILYQERTLDTRQRERLTTLCLLVVLKERVFYSHVGDSRIYLLRKDRLELLTRDDILSEGGTLKPPLSLAMGLSDTLDPLVLDLPLTEGDCYLMCSDGITDVLDLSEIKSILKYALEPKENVLSLIQHALHAGSRDNLSAVIIQAFSN